MTIDDLQQQNPGGLGVATGTAGVFDIGDEGKKDTRKVAPKKVGLSVINPGSLRRKAPKGIRFA